MIRLVVRVIGTKNNIENILATVESNQYDPEHLDALINDSLDRALHALNEKSFDSLRSWNPEVSVFLDTADESIRPSLNLTPKTLSKLFESGSSFDFDPY